MPVGTRRTPAKEKKEPPAEDPYEAIDAPQFADLSAIGGSGLTMSPGASAWFPEHARESVPTPPGASQPPPPTEAPPPPTPPPAPLPSPSKATKPAAAAAPKPAAAAAAPKPAVAAAATKAAAAVKPAPAAATTKPPAMAAAVAKPAVAASTTKPPAAAAAAAKLPAPVKPPAPKAAIVKPDAGTSTSTSAEPPEAIASTPATITAPVPSEASATPSAEPSAAPSSAAPSSAVPAAPAPAPARAAAVRVPAAASKPTKSSQAWAASAAKPAAPAPAAAPAPPGPPTKPMPPSLSTMNRVRGVEDPKPTTEEMQMLAAAREMRKNKQQRDKWRAQLDTVLANAGSKLPARSTAQLTVPQEFHLHAGGSRSVPTSPRSSPSPRERKAGLEVKTFGERVHEFTKTPKRFRGKGPLEPPSPTPSPKAAPTLTKTQSFHLASDSRSALREPVKSTAEREIEYVQSHASAFKARPVNRKVLDSAGDLGVPRVAKREPTEPREFALTTSKLAERKRLEKSASGANGGASKRPGKDDDDSSDAGSTASAPGRFVFKARPFNRALMEGRLSGLAQVSPRKATRPKSPKLSTNDRAAIHAPKEEKAKEELAKGKEVFSSFKARPMPNHALGPSPLPTPEKPRSLTTPQPFELQSVARHEVFEETRQRMIESTEEQERKARQFKAKPMPVADMVWRPQTDAKHTSPREFALTTSARSEIYQEKQAHLKQAQEVAAKRASEFKAREPKVLAAPAFAPRKSTKPLTEIVETNLPFSKTEERTVKRRELEAANLLRRQAMEAAAAEKAKELALKEAREIAALRKSLEFKAKPAHVLSRPAFVLSKGTTAKRSLTTPREFNLSSSVRAA